MRRFERLVRDPVLLDEMLKLFDFVTVSFHDEEYPYAVPLNYGYEIKDGKLYIYIHTISGVGHKLSLIKKNPKVCATFALFFNFPHNRYKVQIHDFRSIMAFGEVKKLQFGKKEFANAMVKILAHADRAPHEFVHSRLKLIDIYAIECDLNDVYGKAEFPIRTVEDVPFFDVFHADPNDTEPFDTTDLVSKKSRANWQHDWLDD